MWCATLSQCLQGFNPQGSRVARGQNRQLDQAEGLVKAFEWYRMHPFWYASSMGVAALLSTWGWWVWFDPDHGEEMLFYIVSLFAWPLVLAACTGLLLFALKWHTHGAWRSAVILGGLGAYWAGHGRPSVWVLGLALAAFVWSYAKARRALADQDALEAL